MSTMIKLENLEENSDSISLESFLLTSLKENNIQYFIEALNSNSSTINHFYLEESPPGTLLDIACRTPGNSQFVDILLKRGANLNAINIHTGKTALHEAVIHSDINTVRLLARNANINVNIFDSDGYSALCYAIINNEVDKIDILMDNGADFMNDLRENSGLMEQYLKGNWIRNVFEKKDCRSVGEMKTKHAFYTPIMKAARYGCYKTVEHLLTHETVSMKPVAGKTVLHVVLDGILASKYKKDTNRVFIENCMAGKRNHNPGADAFYPPRKYSLFSDEKEDHHRCLEYILKNVPSNQLDINFTDDDGNTALHYAVAWKEMKAIEALLQAGAYTCIANEIGMIPLKSFSSQMLEQYLDGCISSNDYSSEHTDYQIIFDYKMFMTPVPQSEEFKMNKKFYRGIRESEPILVMNRVPRLRKLLVHPLIRSYVHLKWRIVRKYFYYHLILYLFYWFFLNSYLFYDFYTSATSSSPSQNISNPNGCSGNFTQSPRNYSENQTEQAFAGNSTSTDGRDNDQQSIFLGLWRVATLIFCAVFIFRYGLPAYKSPRSYLMSAENWLELSLFALTFGLLTFKSRMDANLQRFFSATIILESWTLLMLLMGRHPFFSIHVDMFKTVSLNFLKSLILYSIMIIAFAFSFHILFNGRCIECNKPTMFDHFLTSILKTLIMLTGEYDASTIPFGEGDLFNISHLFFILFLFLITIVLFNLLSGLAVGDIQKIRNDVETISIFSCIKFISSIETLGTNSFVLDKKQISLFFPFRNGKFKTFPNRSRLTRTKLSPQIIENAVNILRKTKQAGEMNDHTECAELMEEYKTKLQNFENILMNLSRTLFGTCPGESPSKKNHNIVRRTKSMVW